MLISKNKIFKIQIILFCISLFILVLSCSKSPRAPKKLIIGSGGSLFLGNNNPVYIQRNANVWETFTQLDDSLEPKPMLAESWKSENDGKTWILDLRRDVFFQNGEHFDSKIAVMNILRLKNHPELDLYSVYANLDTAYAVEDFKIKLEFKYSLVDFPSKIGHYFIGLFTESSFDKNGKIIKPFGCGPYELVEIKTGEYDRFKSFKNFYKGSPAFDEVEFRIISDPIMRIMALIRGDIDIIAHQAGLLPQHIRYLKGFPEIKVDSFMVGVTHYMLLNYESDFFKNKNNRTRFNNILDREEIVRAPLENKGYIAEDFFVHNKALWSKARFSKNIIVDKNIQFSKIKDKKLIFLLNQKESINYSYKPVAEYICNLLEKEGLNVEIVSMEGEVYKKYLQSGKYDLAFYPLSIPTGTPELFLRALAYSKGMQTRRYSLTHYKSEILDSLFEKSLHASSLPEQQYLYNEILDLVKNEKIIIPIFHEKYYIAYNRRIKNLKVDLFMKPDLSAIQLDK
jgi:ABC-type transport system substrate-binding protein